MPLVKLDTCIIRYRRKKNPEKKEKKPRKKKAKEESKGKKEKKKGQDISVTGRRKLFLSEIVHDETCCLGVLLALTPAVIFLSPLRHYLIHN